MLATVIEFLLQFSLLAQAPVAPAAGQADDPYFLPRMLATFVPIAVLFYFMLIRPQKQKEKAIRDRINSMKENDRVVTIGGIHGVVTNVKRDNEQVTIRVDEANGTKLRMNMSAIARVLSDEDQDGSSTGANKT